MALREILAKFGFEVDNKKLQQANKDVDGFKNKLGALAGLVGAGIVYQGVKSFIGDMIVTGSQLNDTSAKLGISTDALQQWGLAAKLSGVEAGGFANALKFLQKNTAAAADGGAEQAKTFKGLGVNIKAADGSIRPTTELLRETGLAIAGMADPAKRTAALMKVFGKSGADLAPMFSEGAEGLDKLLAKFAELGGGLSADAIAELDKAGDQTDEFKFAVLSLKSKLVVQLFPAINKGIGFLIKLIGAMAKATEGTQIFKAIILVLGAVAVAAAVKMYAAYLPMIAVFALLFLLVDELLTLFAGGDTLIGRAIDALFGAGTAADMVKSLKDTWSEFFGDLPPEADTFGEKVEEVFSRVGASFARFFVDEIPAAWTLFWTRMNTELDSKGTTMGAYLEEMFSQFGAILVTWAVNTSWMIIDALADGLVEGVIAIADRVVGAFDWLADEITSALRNQFDWHSPAGLTKELGIDLGRGLIIGQDQIRPDVLRATEANFGPDMFSGWAPPSVARGGASGAAPGRPVTVTYHVAVSVAAGTPVGTAEAARSGVTQGLRDAREADLAALEPVAE